MIVDIKHGLYGEQHLIIRGEHSVKRGDVLHVAGRRFRVTLMSPQTRHIAGNGSLEEVLLQEAWGEWL